MMHKLDQSVDETIEMLPAILAEARANAKSGWGGSTVDIVGAFYDVIEVLKKMWINLAYYYPENHFNNEQPEKFIENFLQQRFVWNRALAEPKGSGTGGTMVGPVTASNVMHDMVLAIEQTVESLRTYEYPNDRQIAWQKRWRKAANK